MNRNPWTGYWQQAGRGCLPEAQTGLARVLAEVWHDFGRGLRPGAKVLDLATGDGTVLRTLSGCGRRLDLIGVDSAPALPKPPPGIRLKAGIAMERLPFPAGRFDAITSQFGIEYGDTTAIASEIGRVLKPGGFLRFVIHHDEGAIVAHNRSRRAALTWVLSESGLLDRARQLAKARQNARLPTPDSFRASIQEAARRFPGQTAGVELTSAVVQTLDLGAARPFGQTVEVLSELQSRAEGEVGRLLALEAAACDPARCEAIAEQLAEAGLKPSQPKVLAAGGDTIAWLLDASA